MLIELDIIPTPQARTRSRAWNLNGKFMVSNYKCKEQVDNERTLEALLAPYKPAEPIQGAVSLEVVAYLPIAASLSQKKKNELSEQYCTKKPDSDNLLKQIMDAMTRLRFWEDDKQVAFVTCSKIYSFSPGWRIYLNEMKQSSHASK